jgi:hypothetical protein
MHKSFSLIEVVVSLAIVSMILAVLLGLNSYATKSSFSSENRLKAVDIARAGIETVRQIRDTGNLKGGLTGCYDLLRPASATPNYVYLENSVPGGCSVPAVIRQIAVGGNSQVFDDLGNPTTTFEAPSALGSLRSAGVLNDDYGRIIVMENKDSLQTGLTKVTSNVYWKENNQLKFVKLETYLGAWW